MQKIDTSIINQDWPVSELEQVDECPYCGAKERTLSYQNLQDLNFFCAPGKWSFWSCNACEALYLNPRPTEASIGRAYSKYVTHSHNNGVLNTIKNECYSHWLNLNIKPRLYIPLMFSKWFDLFKGIITIPFGINELSKHPKGSLLDVGCGSGNMLYLAKQFGWAVKGVEIDAKAVEVARSRGVEVIHGNYKILADLNERYDCVYSSHVLEHVHNPREMLSLITRVLKPNGLLMLSLPNAACDSRMRFKENWFDLDPPRHLAIPTLKQIKVMLNASGFEVIEQVDCFHVSDIQSLRRLNKKTKVTLFEHIFFKAKLKIMGASDNDQSSFIQIVARKNNI